MAAERRPPFFFVCHYDYILMMRHFSSFACFDWSGQAVAYPAGISLAVLDAHADAKPKSTAPAQGWSREAVKYWLLQQAEQGSDMLIGFDLSPALPFCDDGAYFPGWEQSPGNARQLWAMIDGLAADEPHMAASQMVRDHPEIRRYFRHGKGDVGDRFGDLGTGRLRVVEHVQRQTGQAASASCFNLVGAAQVGKSSLTGMRLFHQLDGRMPIWPFDPIPETGPMLVEIYTSIAAMDAGLRKGQTKIRDRATLIGALDRMACLPPTRLPDYSDHRTDAIITAAWLRQTAPQHRYWQPEALSAQIAETEGWTFGVT
ncbi:hypothetical protein [Alterisphingorhabdus coralli]|uniref:DUF429 domain-containing protein n=1 Tax=Alterisphingorhabdus coralli TaxID=3071408 RepID=A0AA97FBM1_9SPHN|nr:hypothetical protein [Parasphingorhabdus sp. SCSIO 66989]WOE76075.1 hypothetical protein RB602_04985 [Parasphingorhabdus sp. SCSIO 66989]